MTGSKLGDAVIAIAVTLLLAACGTAPNGGMAASPAARFLSGAQARAGWAKASGAAPTADPIAARAANRAQAQLYALLNQQASLLSYLDCFVSLVLPAGVGLILAMSIKNFRPPQKQAPAH